MPVIDFNQAMQSAKNASFEPLTPGEYNVTCIEATPTESSNGKPMIRTKWQVEDGPAAGKKVFNQFVFSADNDNALSFFFQHMKFLGLDESFFAANPPWEQVASMLVSRRCRMQVEIREWNGQPRNDVKKILPPMAPTGMGMPQDAVTPMQPVQMPPVQQPVMQAPVQQPVVPQQPMQMPQMPPAQAPAPVAPAAPAVPAMPTAPVAPPAPQPAPVAPPMPEAPAAPPIPGMPVAQPVPPAPAPQPTDAVQPQYTTQQVGGFTVIDGAGGTPEI